jgi:hypothetical protein
METTRCLDYISNFGSLERQILPNAEFLNRSLLTSRHPSVYRGLSWEAIPPGGEREMQRGEESHR